MGNYKQDSQLELPGMTQPIEYPKQNKSMKEWIAEDTPSGKMLLRGRMALTDAEVLALVIGSGSEKSNALDTAKSILEHFQNNLTEFSKATVHDLTKFKGIGLFKATQIIACFEMFKRFSLITATYRERISTSKDSYEIAKALVGNIPYEEFWILLLNRAKKLLKSVKISEGGMCGTVVDPKRIFKVALDNHASEIILFHNHPSGIVTPSEADRKITRQIRDAGVMLEIQILDHLIIGDSCYYSFCDEGTL